MTDGTMTWGRFKSVCRWSAPKTVLCPLNPVFEYQIQQSPANHRLPLPLSRESATGIASHSVPKRGFNVRSLVEGYVGMDSISLLRTYNVGLQILPNLQMRGLCTR